MRNVITLSITLALLMVVITCPVSAYLANPGSASDNGNIPTIIVEYGKGKDAGLVKVTHIHYAKSEAKGRPPRTDTCYKLAGWKWSTLPIQYIVNPNSTALKGAVDAADLEWDIYTGKELFAPARIGDKNYSWGIRDFNNTISFGDYSSNGVIAVTATWYTRITKAAVESDILFDVDFTWGNGYEDPSVMDMQNIATHEIGHTLGLSDLYTSSCSAVTMYGYSWEGDTQKSTLESADITGLQKLYGV